MNSTLKPVLTAPSQNNASAAAAANKTAHPQGASVPFNQQGQSSFPNTNVAHNHPTAQSNHYSLNVPGGGAHFNMGTIPASNHPVAMNQPSGAQNFNSSKTVYSGYQNATQNQNTVPPVSQTLPATTSSSTSPQAAVMPVISNANSSNVKSSPIKEADTEKDKPHANGTSNVQPPVPAKSDKHEVHGNHVTAALPSSVHVQEHKPVTAVPSIPQQQADKPKPTQPTQEKKPVVEPPAPPVSEPKPAQEATKVSVEPAQPAPVPKVQAVQSAPLAVSVSAVTPALFNESSESEQLQNDSPDSDPLAIDSAAVAQVEKSAEQRESVPIIQARDIKEASDDDKSYEDPSSEEADSESGVPEEDVKKPPARRAKAAKTDSKPVAQKSPSSTKVKRQRIRTQHYQSPLPEIEIITKITSTPRSRNTDDKLIYFYKNEFLAVRNAEGSFYVCQAVQNIYKSSSKIKIRWLSQDKGEKSGEIYTPDFYDTTDFDCILTSLDLTRVGKGKYRLKPAEKSRTDSILKRCFAVEKGEISQASVSAEHPDGLDLSLYEGEEQIKKKKRGAKRKGRPRSQTPTPKKGIPTRKSPESPKARRVEPKPSKAAAKTKKTVVSKKPAGVEPKKAARVATTVGRVARAKSKTSAKAASIVDQKKAKVLAKIGRKAAAPAGSTKQQTAKNAKAMKPSTSKAATKSAPPKPVPRKAKRSARK